MPASQNPLVQLLKSDPRYKLEAYLFVQESLTYARDSLRLGSSESSEGEPAKAESHLSGQQLCEAARVLAIEQYGLLAQVVLAHWGIRSTKDIGNLVYNLINIGLMKKSRADRREDFDDVYEFDEAFQQDFKATLPE